MKSAIMIYTVVNNIYIQIVDTAVRVVKIYVCVCVCNQFVIYMTRVWKVLQSGYVKKRSNLARYCIEHGNGRRTLQ